jgi:hypothetical protein
MDELIDLKIGWAVVVKTGNSPAKLGIITSTHLEQSEQCVGVSLTPMYEIEDSPHNELVWSLGYANIGSIYQVFTFEELYVWDNYHFHVINFDFSGATIEWLEEEKKDIPNSRMSWQLFLNARNQQIGSETFIKIFKKNA